MCCVEVERRSHDYIQDCVYDGCTSRSGSLRRGNEPRQVKLVHVKVEVNTSEASSCTNNLLQMYLQQTV
jgi:hypothetical protein